MREKGILGVGSLFVLGVFLLLSEGEDSCLLMGESTRVPLFG